MIKGVFVQIGIELDGQFLVVCEGFGGLLGVVEVVGIDGGECFVCQCLCEMFGLGQVEWVQWDVGMFLDVCCMVLGCFIVVDQQKLGGLFQYQMFQMILVFLCWLCCISLCSGQVCWCSDMFW